MKKQLFWAALILLVIVAAFFLLSPKQEAPKPTPPVTAQKISEKTAGVKPNGFLPQVITIYQKNERMDSRALSISRELAITHSSAADFQSINILEEPQIADYYGVTSTPTIIFATPSGRVYKKFVGSMSKDEILSLLSASPKN